MNTQYSYLGYRATFTIIRCRASMLVRHPLADLSHPVSQTAQLDVLRVYVHRCTSRSRRRTFAPNACAKLLIISREIRRTPPIFFSPFRPHSRSALSSARPTRSTKDGKKLIRCVVKVVMALVLETHMRLSRITARTLK